MRFRPGDRAQSPATYYIAGTTGENTQLPQHQEDLYMKKHGICDFVPDFPVGKKARKDMVLKVDLTPLMSQMYHDNLEMAEKLGRLEAQLEMMQKTPAVEINPTDIEMIENEEESNNE